MKIIIDRIKENILGIVFYIPLVTFIQTKLPNVKNIGPNKIN
jgi:hypothetical protein